MVFKLTSKEILSSTKQYPEKYDYFSNLTFTVENIGSMVYFSYITESGYSDNTQITYETFKECFTPIVKNKPRKP